MMTTRPGLGCIMGANLNVPESASSAACKLAARGPRPRAYGGDDSEAPVVGQP